MTLWDPLDLLGPRGFISDQQNYLGPRIYLGPPCLFGPLGLIRDPLDYLETKQFGATRTYQGAPRLFGPLGLIYPLDYLELPGFIQDTRESFGNTQTIWAPRTFWDYLDYLGPQEFIWDPRDSFGTPRILFQTLWTIWDPRVLFGTPRTIKFLAQLLWFYGQFVLVYLHKSKGENRLLV